MDIKPARQNWRELSGVSCRFHDLRHKVVGTRVNPDLSP
jgi:hypothetical protein